MGSVGVVKVKSDQRMLCVLEYFRSRTKRVERKGLTCEGIHMNDDNNGNLKYGVVHVHHHVVSHVVYCNDS